MLHFTRPATANGLRPSPRLTRAQDRSHDHGLKAQPLLSAISAITTTMSTLMFTTRSTATAAGVEPRRDPFTERTNMYLTCWDDFHGCKSTANTDELCNQLTDPTLNDKELPCYTQYMSRPTPKEVIRPCSQWRIDPELVTY